MSELYHGAAEDVEFVNRPHQVAVVARIPGTFSLANRRGRNGERRKFACLAVNITPHNMTLATPVGGPVGERVIAYFQEFGKIQGAITRVLDGGFAIRIVATGDERSKLMRKLIWLDQNKNYDVPDVRAHKRVIPQDPLSNLVFADGTVIGCLVIDMSESGAAVSADVVPPLGTVVAIGKVTGRVVRHFNDGFAVRFKNLQNPEILEQVLIHRW
jgi:hypothetical protein